MALTVESIQHFQGFATLTSGSSSGDRAGWTINSGSLRKRVGGARYGSDAAPGMGGIFHHSDPVSMKYTMSTVFVSANVGMVVDFWVKFDSLSVPSGSASTCSFVNFRDDYDEYYAVRMWVDQGDGINGTINFSVHDWTSNPGTDTNVTPIAYRMGTWVRFAIGYRNNATATTYDVGLWTYNSSGVWAQFYTQNCSQQGGVQKVPYVFFFENQPTNQAIVNGRFGHILVGTITALTDIASVESLVSAPPASLDYYVSKDAAGSSNTGLVDNPWNPTQLVDELAHGGVIASRSAIVYSDNTPVPVTLPALDLWIGVKSGAIRHHGSKVHFSAADGELVLPSPLIVDYGCEGVQLLLPGSSALTLNPSTIPAWTLESGAMYRTAWAYTHAGLWEDGKRLTFVPFPGTTAALKTAIVAAGAGSWGFDGTNVYVIATGAGNPGSNGKTYRLAPESGGCVSALAADFWMDGPFLMDYTGLVERDASAAVGDAFDGNLHGFSILRGGARTLRSGKHGVSYAVRPLSTFSVIIDGIRCEQGLPRAYTTLGGQQTPFVLYTDEGGTFSGQVMLNDINAFLASEVVGSLAGSSDTAATAGILFHDSGGSYSPLTFVGLRKIVSNATVESVGTHMTTGGFTAYGVNDFGTGGFAPPEGLTTLADVPLYSFATADATVEVAPLAVDVANPFTLTLQGVTVVNSSSGPTIT